MGSVVGGLEVLATSSFFLLVAMTSNLLAMASNLLAKASNLLAMASTQ